MSNKSHFGETQPGLLDRVPLVGDGSAREERANGVTHAAATLGALAATVELLHLGIVSGRTLVVAAIAVFGFSLVALYTVSTIYHFVAEGRVKRLFRLLDHVSVLYLIAGSYTVVLLLFFHGPIHWIIFGIEWGLAAIGTVYKVFFLGKAKALSFVIYLGMGWLALIAWPQLVSLHVGQLSVWLLGGGVLYTSGLFFFGLKRLPYNHAVWHLFVMAGTACQIIGILEATRIIYG